MYHLYIPLSQPFSPCLALAREIVNRFLRVRRQTNLHQRRGAAGPAQLFNASPGGKARRAIDIREGEEVDAEAFKALILAAVALNAGKQAGLEPDRSAAALRLSRR